VATFILSGYFHSMPTLQEALEPLGFHRGDSHGVRAGDSPDFFNETTILEVQAGSGFRDIQAAIIKLAIQAHNPEIHHAILLAQEPRVSSKSMAEEWQRSLSVLIPEIKEKLALIVLYKDTWFVLPESSYLERIARHVAGISPVTQRRPNRSFEVLRVLVTRWLQHQPSISHALLMEQTGLSYPTIRDSLAEIEEVKRASDRSVFLQRFPYATWARLLAFSDEIRQTQAFMDASGRFSPYQLFERLKSRHPSGVGIGGVLAARHWHPAFDLEGIPRLDLSVPLSMTNLDFIKQVFPTLVPAPKGTPPVLVVHQLVRKQSLFSKSENIYFADPAEVLLDLQELRLEVQAEELKTFLRSLK
jgi:hypothetical protein